MPTAILTRMLYRDCSAREEDIETNLAVEVVQAGHELTLRAIARQRGVDAATLVRRWGSRDAMLDAVLLTMECRWIQGIRRRWRDTRCDDALGCGARDGRASIAGIAGLLPDLMEESDDPYDSGTHHTVTELSIVSVFRELTRNRPRSRDIVLEIRASERELVEESLADVLGRPPSTAQLDAVCALLDGLRRRLVDRHEPLALAAAHDALRVSIEAWRADAMSPASPPGPSGEQSTSRRNDDRHRP